VTKRRALAGFVSRALGLGLLVGALVLTVASAPAGAAPSPPGPLGALQPDQWIAFTVSPSSPNFGDPVTLNAQSGTTGTDPAPSTTQLFTSGTWPTEWSANGVTLDHSGTPCPASASSCSFTISGSAGPHSGVFFGVGPVPDSVAQAGDGQTVTVPEMPTTTTPPTVPPTTPPPTSPPGPNATFTGPPNNQLSGGFTFTAPAQNGQGPYTYDWELTSNGSTVASGNQSSFTPPSSIFTSPTATYTLTLKVTDGLGASATNQVQFEVATQVGTPPPPQSSGGQGPAPTPVVRPSAPVLGRTTLNAVSYAPQLARFATPTPGAVQPVTVIWLWRPNWFGSTQTAKTAGTPKAVKRADVSVDPAHGGSGQNATPELAALAAFGIFGFGWILFKRRRVRSALLD